LLSESNGDFRIGAETFSKKLEYDEMVELPLDKLLEIGWADLHKNQAHFQEIAKELEPDKTPREVLEELGEKHPAPDQLLNSFRATFDGLITYIRAHHIVTIPSDVRPIVEETPAFMRATTTASKMCIRDRYPPLSARIIPYCFIAVKITWLTVEKPEMSKLAFNRIRIPMTLSLIHI